MAARGRAKPLEITLVGQDKEFWEVSGGFSSPENVALGAKAR